TAQARGADQTLRHAGIRHLFGGRQEAEDAEAPSAHDVRYDARRIPREMGPPPRIPHGCTQLRGPAFGLCEEDRARPQTLGGRPPPGTLGLLRGVPRLIAL